MNTQSPFGLSSTANTTSQAGTLFGASNTNTSAGTLFGTNTSNSSSAGTLFGGAAASGFGGFSKPATTNSFGTTTSQPAAAPATSGFGGFGKPATSTATTGFGTLGQPAASTAATGFGGFGQPAASTAPATTGFFGQTPAATGFGGQTSTAPNATGFGGFGQTAASTAPATTSLFGQNASSVPVNSTGFGAFRQPGPTAFGMPLTNTAQPNTVFGQPAATNKQQMIPPVQDKVWQEFALIRAHFDPTSPLCQFRHYFYNMVPSNEVHLYVRPQNQNEQLWNEAMRKNPDPTCLVPVLAIGFDDILKRMEIQNKQIELHEEKLNEGQERFTNVQRQLTLGTLVKLGEFKRRHMDLVKRLLRLLRYSQVLRYKGFPLNADEEKLMSQLQNISSNPNNPNLLNQKLAVLYNQLQAVKAQRNDTGNSKAWRSVREEDTTIIAKILEEEQKGIKHIASILNADSKELEVIEVGLKSSNKMN